MDPKEELRIAQAERDAWRSALRTLTPVAAPDEPKAAAEHAAKYIASLIRAAGESGNVRPALTHLMASVRAVGRWDGPRVGNAMEDAEKALAAQPPSTLEFSSTSQSECPLCAGTGITAAAGDYSNDVAVCVQCKRRFHKRG